MVGSMNIVSILFSMLIMLYGILQMHIHIEPDQVIAIGMALLVSVISLNSFFISFNLKM